MQLGQYTGTGYFLTLALRKKTSISKYDLGSILRKLKRSMERGDSACCFEIEFCPKN